MSNEIVLYANQLNQISFSPLGAQQQNAFFSFVCRLKNQESNEIKVTSTQLAKICSMNYTQENLLDFAKSLKDTIFKIDFTEISADGLVERCTHMFDVFEIHAYMEDGKKKLDFITLRLNHGFIPIFNRLTKNFTEFELTQFTLITGKYAKTLFRLLVQFKASGKATFKWKEFKELMGIPETYKALGKIEDRVLKPAIKELTWDDGQTDIFTDYKGDEIPLFRDLKYKKIKKDPSKKTSPIVAIEFSFKVHDKFKKEFDQLPYVKLTELLNKSTTQARRTSITKILDERNQQLKNLSVEQLKDEFSKGQDSMFDGNNVLFELQNKQNPVTN